MDEFISCPHSGAPAQIAERFWLGSTADPVEHLKTHWHSHQRIECAGTYRQPKMKGQRR